MKSRNLVLALILLSLSFAGSAGAAPTCADLDRWAANLTQLPTDYASFAALPEANRRAVYPLLSDGERAGLWQAHWQAALAGGRYSREQEAVIYEAIAAFDANAFAALRPEARNHAAAVENLKAFEARVAAVFEKRQATRLFADLGPVRLRQLFEVEQGDGDGTVITDPGGPVGPGQPVVIDCSCSTASDWCTSPAKCYTANCRRVSGCGTLWQYTCDGLCATIVVVPPSTTPGGGPVNP